MEFLNVNFFYKFTLICDRLNDIFYCKICYIQEILFVHEGIAHTKFSLITWFPTGVQKS
jgi:hypothetical protein